MQRVDAPEILDSDKCSSQETQEALAVLGRINRWFGGVATTQKIVERAALVMGVKQVSMLDVAAGTGEVPELVRQRVARRGIRLDVTLLDAARSHLPEEDGSRKDCVPCSAIVVADALALPFKDDAFDLVNCNLFAHHLSPPQLAEFARESLRVSRQALLINDLVRHPLHLALVYASFPIMRNRVAWLDGLTSVRRAYIPAEIRSMLATALGSGVRVEISRHYLFRMGVIVWKDRH